MSIAARKVAGEELYLFLAYAFIVLRPGATPPKPTNQNTIAVKPIPGGWSASDYQLFIDESRIDVANQQTDKREIRARAQIVLTTAIVLGGVLVNSYLDRSDLCLCMKLAYGASALCLCLATLAAGGVISARSDIGTVNVTALTHYGAGDILRTVARGYAETRETGSLTIAALVTVLRDCVAALVLGAGILAVAHLAGRT